MGQGMLSALLSGAAATLQHTGNTTPLFVTGNDFVRGQQLAVVAPSSRVRVSHLQRVKASNGERLY